MIVDDARVVVDRLVPALQELGNVDQVLTAKCFEEAVSILENRPVGVLLIDMNLPGKSGIDLVKKIRSANYPVKAIIIMTEDNGSYKKDWSLSTGADYFFDKFESFDEIISLVSTF